MDPRQHDDLVTALRAAARELAGRPSIRDLAGRPSIRDLEETLGQIVTSAVAAIPGVDAGSISITEHGRIETRHPTTEAGPRPPRPADVPAARQTSPSSSGVS